ncbi:MAG: accessory factor UbiK family protein [Burkholderiales bacterium]|nr:accessory factor UbiK family protein [Burkholderiales bacterium]
MIDASTLERLQQRIAQVLAKTPAKDVEANTKAMLQGFFARMELVTREEFDVQQAVLQRALEQLDQLSRRVQELEAAGSVADPKTP